jgi:hypothetical protein
MNLKCKCGEDKWEVVQKADGKKTLTCLSCGAEILIFLLLHPENKDVKWE